jgi:hypothetical protein
MSTPNQRIEDELNNMCSSFRDQMKMMLQAHLEELDKRYRETEANIGQLTTQI